MPCHLSLPMARCPVTYLPSWQGVLSLTVPCHLSPLMARCPITYLPSWNGPVFLLATLPWRVNSNSARASVRYHHSALLRSNKVEGIKPERDTNGHLLPLKRGPSSLTPSLKHPTPTKPHHHNHPFPTYTFSRGKT